MVSSYAVWSALCGKTVCQSWLKRPNFATTLSLCMRGTRCTSSRDNKSSTLKVPVWCTFKWKWRCTSFDRPLPANLPTSSTDHTRVCVCVVKWVFVHTTLVYLPPTTASGEFKDNSSGVAPGKHGKQNQQHRAVCRYVTWKHIQPTDTLCAYIRTKPDPKYFPVYCVSEFTDCGLAVIQLEGDASG